MHIDLWSDIVCPWCAIGKAHLEQALRRFVHGDAVTVRWRSFELDPSAPATVDGVYVERLAAKYGTSVADAQTMVDRMTAHGTREGVHFRFDIARPGNTFDAHRVLRLAAERGLQGAVNDRLLHAALTEGAAIGDPLTLQQLAVDAGLDEVEVKDTLGGDAYADAVRADERLAAALGVRGVPFLVVDGRLAVSGAQPADVLVEVLEQAWAQRARATPERTGTPAHGLEGHVCEGDQCTV